MLIYDKKTILKEENFQSNGLGYLTDFMSEPIITEKLNGTFELQFDYLLTGNNAQYLENFNYIKAWYDDGYQLFYIERVKRQKNKISVYALHIAFTLTRNNLSDVRPTDLTAIAALEYILKRTDETNYFKAVGNATKGGISTMYFINKNPIEALLTADNSIINRLGGEIKYDNFNIGLYDEIGNDNGVTVLWGKNLKQFEQDNDVSSVITRVIPIGKEGLTLPEGHIDSPLINSYPFPLIKTIDIDVGIEEDESKTDEQLRNEAYERMRKEVQKLFNAGLDKPTTTVKIDWQDLSKTEEYKNYQFLEKIKLGDTISVKALNILVKTRVIETKYNCLSKKYISFTLGDARDNLFDGTSKLVQKEIKNLNIDPDSLLKQAQDRATKLLTDAMGGFVYKTNNELYIMDTDDPKTAQKVWRWNINGLGYSNNGINGPYGLAMTMDGQIVADFITTGKMSVERIEGLEEILLVIESISDGIKEVSGTNSINLDNVLTSELLYLDIAPTTEDLIYLNVSNMTELGNDTELLSRDLLFVNIVNNKIIRYTLPSNLYYVDDVVKDELIVDYEKKQTYVIHRVGIDPDTYEKYILSKEIIEYFDYKEIIIEDGSYTAKMQSFNNCYIKIKYLYKTLYTSQNATKAELSSSLKLTEESIVSNVNKQITSMNGEILSLSSQITQTATEISSKVAKGAIISTINQSAETVKISANKIALAAGDILNLLANNTINLSSKNIQIESTNFTVTSDGHIIAKKGELEDCTINGGYLNLKNGASVVGDNGLATNLIYPGYVRGKYTTGGGDFVPLGHVGGGGDANSQRNTMMFTFKLPTNFTIKSAKIYILHAPIKWVGVDDGDITGYSRHLKLYKLSNFNLTYNQGNGGIYSNSTGSEITNAFGANGFDGNSSSASYAVSNDITSQISKTALNQLYIRTSDGMQTSNKEIFARSGGVTGYLEIIGYMNF